MCKRTREQPCGICSGHIIEDLAKSSMVLTSEIELVNGTTEEDLEDVLEKLVSDTVTEN